MKKQEAAAPIKIATKPMTEQFILGEMLKLVIEDTTDYSVELTKGIGGGTNNIMPAMESGDFDLYPEYTSSGYIMVLKHDSDGISDEDMWKQLLAGLVHILCLKLGIFKRSKVRCGFVTHTVD